MKDWSNIVIYVTVVGWFFDNVLAGVPSLKSNSSFQLICNIIDTVVSYAKSISVKKESKSEKVADPASPAS